MSLHNVQVSITQDGFKILNQFTAFAYSPKIENVKLTYRLLTETGLCQIRFNPFEFMLRARSGSNGILSEAAVLLEVKVLEYEWCSDGYDHLLESEVTGNLWRLFMRFTSRKLPLSGRIDAYAQPPQSKPPSYSTRSYTN